MPKRILTLAIAALLLRGAAGLAAAPGGRFSIRVWHTADGLPDEAILSLAQTTDGYLWVGTLNGLARFDGNRFTRYDENNTPGLKASSITRLFEDSHQHLWIGTETAGLAVVKDGGVEPVQLARGSSMGRPHSICEDSDGTIWVSAEGQPLLRFKDGNLQTNSAISGLPDRCRLAIADKSGTVWISTDSGLYAVDSPYVQADLVWPGANVTYLLASSSGGFWCLADGHIQRWRNHRLERDLGPFPWNADVICACEDREGNLVVGTGGEGVYWFDAAGKFVHLTRHDQPGDDQDLSHDFILSLVVDRDGDLWVGTNGRGLDRVKRSPFGVLPDTDKWTVQSVAEDRDGGLWVGFNGAYPGGGGAVEYFKDGLQRQLAMNKDCYVRSVFVDRANQVWAGTWGPWDPWRSLPAGGLFTNLPDNPSPVRFAMQLQQSMWMVETVQSVSAIYEDSHNTIWVGTRNGLCSWQNNQWTNRDVPHGDLPAADVRAIAEDATGNLWLGTENEGLERLRDGKFTAYHKQDGLPSEHISALQVDGDGVLWVATAGGLAWLSDGHWAQYTTSNGLVSDRLDYLVADTHSNLWLGSNRGLIRVSKADLTQLGRGATDYVFCRAYAESDGLPSGQCTAGSQPAACRTRDGRLLFPTISGLVTLDTDAIKPNTNVPPVVIESVSVEGSRQGQQGLGSAPPGTITFPSRREDLEIEYTSLSPGAADSARFAFQMQPLEKKWFQAGSSRTARYPKLPPGNYTFLVKACNEDGVWSDSPASLSVIVLPPFWQTRWFLGISGIVLLGMIVGGVHYASTQKLQRQLAGLRQQQALEKERSRIARDIHDQLGASLTQVSLLGELVESDKHSPGEVEAHGRQISQTARDVTRALDEIVWTVNPSNDTIEGLVNYFCKYTQEYLAVAGLRFRLDAPPQLPAAVISPEARHNVFLAAKEAITNVVRHAQATSVFVRVRVESGAFVLEIEDDGRGIPNLQEKLAGSRNGLRNMARRMEDVGGRFDVRPAPEHGAIIRLTVPINNPAA